MRAQFEEYTDMVSDLTEGGFEANQSEALATLIARLFSRQHEFFERIREDDRKAREESEGRIFAKLDRIRGEDQEDRERIRREDLEDRERIRREDKEDRERIRREDLDNQVRARGEMREDLAKIDARWAQMNRWVITTLTTLVVSVFGAAIVFALRFLN